MTSPTTFARDAAPAFLDRRPAFLPLAIAALFAVVGAALLPYGYYVFLRYVLTLTSVFIVVHAIRSKQFGWLGLAIPMLILWSPAPWITLPRAVWGVFDVMVAALLIFAGSLIPAPMKVDENGQSVPWSWWKIALLVYGVGACLVVVMSSGGSTGNPDCVTQYDRYGASCE
jgi:hypothetical protein